jgi:hypothetical protein
MAKAVLDMQKLNRSIERYAKQFGDSTAQATIRWGVQAARELAVSTAVFGGRGGGKFSASGAKKRQMDAIWMDALQVILAVDSATRTPSGYKITNQGKTYYVPERKFLTSEAQVNQWIRINRTRRRRRTPKMPVEERKVALRKTVEGAIKLRAKAIGEAKGGWLAAGKNLAGKQTGAQRITIGAGYIGYAQKTSATGSSSVSKNLFAPVVKLTNNVAHSGDKSVLSSKAAQDAINGALPNTLKWYRMALRPKKSKP